MLLQTDDAYSHLWLTGVWYNNKEQPVEEE